MLRYGAAGSYFQGICVRQHPDRQTCRRASQCPTGIKKAEAFSIAAAAHSQHFTIGLTATNSLHLLSLTIAS